MSPRGSGRRRVAPADRRSWRPLHDNLLRQPGHRREHDRIGSALAIMDAEKIERFHLAGHSMGGLIAQEIALRAPDRVKSLALLCTFARGKQATRLTVDIVLIGLRTLVEHFAAADSSPAGTRRSLPV
ncbi:MAG TPA: alpha/beta fold hydrolase [Polyangia bacterium]|nr:alpha/beta fold hydrolase [Polyangia bacterium]